MAKKQTTEDSVAVKAAKVIGKAAGKIASLAGAAAPEPGPPSAAKSKKGKLPKKNKSRLPRRQKKAQQKAANQPPK